MVLNSVKQDIPSSIIIQDSWKNKGRNLFRSLLHHYSQNGYKIQYHKYDSPLSGEIEEFDAVSFKPIVSTLGNAPLKEVQDLLNLWNVSTKDEKIIIAVDSLSPVLLHTNVGIVCSAIAKLCRLHKVHFIALIHGDVHEDDLLKNLRYSVDCYLTVTSSGNQEICSGLLKKPGGKIVDSVETYSVKDRWQLVDIREQKAGKDAAESKETAAIPKSSFRLELDENEEKARSQVVLPYIRKPNVPRKGEIIYEAEAADWEDEDPDDDLEI